MEQVKLSIITVVRNGEEHIEDTLKSVLDQGYGNIEYLIVDGASTDNTLGIVENYVRSEVKVISEPDSGIYNAMNKGIRLSSGNLIGIQNSDDYYEPNIFSYVVQAHHENPNAVIYGYQRIIDEKGERQIRSLPHSRLPDFMIPHPTCFVPRILYKEYGLFDEDYKIAADYDLMLRFYRAGVPFIRLDRVVSSMRRGGVSTRHASLSRFEAAAARHKNGYVDDKTFRRFQRLYIVRKILKAMKLR